MDKITHQVRAEHWAKIMNECINSGMSKTAWCRANGISEKQFFYWQRILRREAFENSANVKHFFTLLGKMFFTPYGKEFFTYPGKQIFTS